MKTLAKYHVFNHCVTGENTFKNKLIGPGKLPGLSRNGPQACVSQNSRELFGPENISGRFSGVFLGSRKVFLRTPESVPNCLPIFFGNLFVLPATIMGLELAERLF